MADLSFLFQKPQAQGLGAGYELGMQDYFNQRQANVADKNAMYTEAMANRMNAMLPGELEQQKYKTAQEAAVSSPEYLGAKTQADMAKYQFEAMDSLTKMNESQRQQIYAKIMESFDAQDRVWEGAGYLLQSGQPTSTVIDQVLSSLPEDKRQQAAQSMQQYRNMPPQQAMQEVYKIRQAIAQQKMRTDPKAILEMSLEQMRQQGQIRRANIQAASSGAGKPTDYQAIVAAVRQSNPNLNAQQVMEEAARIYSGRAAAGQPQSTQDTINVGGKEVVIGGRTRTPGVIPEPVESSGGWGATRIK